MQKPYLVRAYYQTATAYQVEEEAWPNSAKAISRARHLIKFSNAYSVEVIHTPTSTCVYNQCKQSIPQLF